MASRNDMHQDNNNSAPFKLPHSPHIEQSLVDNECYPSFVDLGESNEDYGDNGLGK